MALVDSLSAREDSIEFEYKKVRLHYEGVNAVFDSLAVAVIHQAGYLEEIGAVQALIDSLGPEYTGISILVDSLARESEKLRLVYEKEYEDLENVLTQYDLVYVSLDIHDILIKSIVLPPTIQNAIQAKLAQEQVAQEFDFRLQRERKEAKRKRIEGGGIKDFQDIVSEGISDNLLRWKAIEATLALAQSQNAKVVVIGAGEEGLPIILGNIERDQKISTVSDSIR